jgi:hypothetical protein
MHIDIFVWENIIAIVNHFAQNIPRILLLLLSFMSLLVLIVVVVPTM